ncbi:MAG: helix-turn-helix transcriptional regulator [Chloroflexota bacterium]
MRNRLRVLRAEYRWSQADLAERLEVSRQTVNAIETGKYDPSLPLAFKIAHLFQQPIERIFQPDQEDSPSVSPTDDQTMTQGR